MQVLVKPFEPEKILARVSSCQGLRPAASAEPPQRLTAKSPSTQTATDAPTSSRSRKLVTKTSRTRSKPGAHEPWMVTRDGSFNEPPDADEPGQCGTVNCSCG